MTAPPRPGLPLRGVLVALAAGLATAGGVALVFSPPALLLMARLPLPTGPAGALLRLALAVLPGLLVGGLLARALFGPADRQLRRLAPLLQEAAHAADESRGREAEPAVHRLESAIRSLAETLAGAPADQFEPLPLPTGAMPAELELVRAVNGVLESARRHRDRIGTLLAQVEDDLVPVHESLDEVEQSLLADGSSAGTILERRRLVGRTRRAVARVERELSAVRHRLGGAPVERLTEADFVGLSAGGDEETGDTS